MPQVYIVGGRQRSDALFREEWHRHNRASVLSLDIEQRTLTPVFDYVSPPENCPDDSPSILFKAATFENELAFLCTNTELLVCRLPDFQVLQRVSHPCFNDVHHVLPAAGKLYTVSTGLDMVIELSRSGEVLRQWSVLNETDPYGCFQRDIDYRKIASTKPHRSHPNHVFFIEEELWVTRLIQRDAVCLTSSNQRIPIDIEKPHDGLVRGDKVYFTTVDGKIVIADTCKKQVIEVIDLDSINPGMRKLGWCRGLEFLDDEHCLVGFSRLRPTKWGENLSWLGTGIQKVKSLFSHPARISLYNLKERRLIWEIPLDSVEDFSTVFSIHSVG